MRIAVIGAGIAGLTAAHLLHERHDITVFEAGAYAGGHTNTVRVQAEDGTYDVDTNTLFWATGNPGPDYNGQNRAGDNLYTSAVLALDPETGKMKWWFQPSPHDTHDWDATQTPVLIDGTINGQPRKLMAQARSSRSATPRNPGTARSRGAVSCRAPSHSGPA